MCLSCIALIPSIHGRMLTPLTYIPVGEASASLLTPLTYIPVGEALARSKHW